jgi:tetratricopeptide (TPR) repeat protein
VAKALARSRGRRSGVPERERELKRLCLSVCDDTGFRLYAATYDQPKRRDQLIARLSDTTKAEKVQVTRLDIADAGSETSLVGLLRAHLQESDLPPDWRNAVMVTGIEQRIDYSSGREGYAFLHQANLLRDALPEAAPVPVVLWLSRLASAALLAEAPDLWDWRAASFDFTGDETPRVELLRELATLQSDDELGLSAEQRRGRIRMLEDLLAELEREGPPKSKREAAERAHLLLQTGIEDWHLGRAAEAIPHFERALDLYQEIGDRRGEGVALGNLGLAHDQLGELRRAIEYFERDLAIARELGDRRGEGQTLGNLGSTYADLGKTRRAIELYEQSLAIAREIGNRRGEANALGDLGNAYADVGNAWRAIEHLEQNLAITQEVGDRRGEGKALGNLGAAYGDSGDLRRAIEYFRQHLMIAREMGDRRGEGTAIGNLGNAYDGLGEPRRAIEHYEQWLAIAREIGDRQGEGKGLFNSALALDQLGERGEAIERVKAALVIFEQIGVEHLAERARAKLAEWEDKGSG